MVVQLSLDMLPVMPRRATENLPVNDVPLLKFDESEIGWSTHKGRDTAQ